MFDCIGLLDNKPSGVRIAFYSVVQWFMLRVVVFLHTRSAKLYSFWLDKTTVKTKKNRFGPSFNILNSTKRLHDSAITLISNKQTTFASERVAVYLNK